MSQIFDIFIRKYEDDAPITVITIKKDQKDNQIKSFSRSNSISNFNRFDDADKSNSNYYSNNINEFTVYDLK
jgi:hypothetical protein